jgi:hypothetical protein
MQSEDQKTTSFDLLEVVEERIKYLALLMSQSDREELAGEVVRYLADRGEKGEWEVRESFKLRVRHLETQFNKRLPVR